MVKPPSLKNFLDVSIAPQWFQLTPGLGKPGWGTVTAPASDMFLPCSALALQLGSPRTLASRTFLSHLPTWKQLPMWHVLILRCQICTGLLGLPRPDVVDWESSTTEIYSHFWRLEVQTKVLAGLVSSEAPFLSLNRASLSPPLPTPLWPLGVNLSVQISSSYEDRLD